MIRLFRNKLTKNKIRIVYDIYVFTEEIAVVACSWRDDYAGDLLVEMVKLHCPDAPNRFTGAVVMREVPIGARA